MGVPGVSAAPVYGTPSLTFKRTHISHTPERHVEIWNPTEADAKWAIAHVPYKAPAAHTAARAHTRSLGDLAVLEHHEALAPRTARGEARERLGGARRGQARKAA